MDGFCYTFGIFLNELAESFDKEPSEVAVISSYLTGTYYLSGPIACALCNKLGFRTVGFIGAITATFILAYASFVENFLLFSILVGFGLGFCFDMVYSVMLLDVGYYFEKYRALATAISVLGVSAGIMGFPPIFTDPQLLGGYHWRMKFRFMAGAFGVLTLLTWGLKPIKPTLIVEEVPYVPTAMLQEDLISSNSGSSGSEEEQIGILGFKNVIGTFHNLLFPAVADYTEDRSTYLAILPELSSEDEVSISRSFYGTGVGIRSSSRRVTGVTSTLSVPSRSGFDYDEDEVGCCPWACLARLKCFRCCKGCCYWCQHLCDSCGNFICCTSSHIQRPMYRDDILYQGSLAYVPEYDASKARQSIKSIRAIGTEDTKSRNLPYHLSVTRVATQKDIAQERQCNICPEAVLRVLATMLDFKLFKSPSFVLLTFSAFLTMIGLYIPFVFMVARGEELKLGGHWPTSLLSMMGAANCLGRMVCGSVSFITWLDATVFSYVTLIIGGAFLIASGFWTDLYGQITAALMYGFCCASFTTLRTVMLTDMLGLENLTNAFGISILFYGIASFLGIPAANYIQGVEGTYTYCFVMAGAVVLLSGVLLIPLKRVNRKEKAKVKGRVSFKK